MRIRTAAPLLLASAAFGAYTYYYTDALTSVNTANWTQNGTLTPTTGGLLSYDANGGSLISKVAVPGGSSFYEVRTVISLAGSGGTYVTYLDASPDALSGPTTSTGTYYAWELQNPTFSGSSCSAQLVGYKRVSGVVTLLSSATVSCHSMMVLRIIRTSGNLLGVYVDDVSYFTILETSITSGKPGVGVRGQTSSQGSIQQVSLGPPDTTPPNPINGQSLGTSAFPNRVDFQWQGTSDDPAGSGIAYYNIYKTVLGNFIGNSRIPEFTDAAVSAGTQYVYYIEAMDFFHNVAASGPITITTPAAGNIDPRRVGVRTTGSYWGAVGEQIDTLSGNLNFSAPLFKAMGRSGWGVGFALSYNSQLWRKDPGGTWKLGRDVGYGFGWRLQAGSLTPYYSFYYTLDHYLFVDSSGAEYRLDQNNGGVWTSSQGIYLSYDSNANRLYFPDGSFWVMGTISAGTEQDAGSQYPSLMEDTNGNQILLRYNQGLNSPWTNSSARIGEIEDVRAVWSSGTGTYQSYTFTYNTDTIPHLTQINAMIQNESESYTLGYLENQALSSPFTPTVSFGTTVLLQSLAVTNFGYGSSFTYDTSGSGELTSATYPYGGKMRWAYRGFTYTGSRTLREVQNRYLTKAVGATETTYPFTRNDAADASKTLHSGVTLDDPSGIGEKAWTFSTTGAAWQLGLTTRFEDRPSAAQASQPLQRQDFTWVQDAVGNPYIGTVLTTLEPAGANVQTKTTQTLDTHGNVTQTNIFNYGNLTTPARTYNNTYVTDANYTSRYIFNRLLTTTVTGLTANLVSNTYDVGALSNVTGQREHDSANYGTGFTYRGNVTATTPIGSPTITYTRDITGNVVSATNSLGFTVATSFQNNYAAPSVITPNSNSNLQTSAAYTPWLAPSSITQPNSATSSTTYGSFGRPYQSTSAYGAVTTYAYNGGGALPEFVTATTGTHWVTTLLDGFGRPTTVTRGYNDGSGAHTVSTVDTVYDSCACSPLGKVKKVSQPYAPGGTVYWTVYTYDGLGRTVSVVLPDGASTTSYAYSGNITTITDPAGKWKKQTVDVFGNIKQVNEPNPAGGADYVTSYTYDLLNHLTQVSMPRPTGTQTRTFVYDATTQRLTSETQPETGTTSYTYNADGTLATKTNARSQVTKYIYDTYQRVTQTQYFPDPAHPTTEDTCARVTWTYDTNTLDATLSQNSWGRPTTATWGVVGCTSSHTFRYMYSYTPGGLITKKRVQVDGHNLDATYTYNSEGRVATVQHPSAQNDPGLTWTYSFDSMGRPYSLVDNEPTPYYWVTSATYGPSDEELQINGVGTRTYNSLLQLTSDGTRGYIYSTTQNNGRIVQTTDPQMGTVIYGYDSLNRLASASSSAGWGETFAYDGFGNLTDKTVTSGAAPPLHVTVNPANNRISTTGYGYDATGNLSSVPGQFWGTYDVQNRMATWVPTSGGTEYYSYGPDNMRVWKKPPSGPEEVYFYGARGEKLGRFSYGTGVFATLRRTVYFVRLNEGQDRLDSTRNQGGYYPYGEAQTAGFNDQDKFATYYRDGTSLLDYARNRYYSSTLGRFMSADPYRASKGSVNNPADPGSWNRYAYVTGDPVNFNDPNGTYAGDAGVGCSVSIDGIVYPCNPNDDNSCLINEFDPTPNPVCDQRPVHTPPPPGPPTPQCSIELWQRPAFSGANPGHHTYLLVDDPTLGLHDEMIEGGPDHEQGPQQGTLKGFESQPGLGLGVGTGHASNPFRPNNHEIGTADVGAGVCGQIGEILYEVGLYNAGHRVPYYALGQYNSNSFTYTLLQSVGLAGYFGTLSTHFNPFNLTRPFYPGWNEIVPGL